MKYEVDYFADQGCNINSVLVKEMANFFSGTGTKQKDKAKMSPNWVNVETDEMLENDAKEKKQEEKQEEDKKNLKKMIKTKPWDKLFVLALYDEDFVAGAISTVLAGWKPWGYESFLEVKLNSGKEGYQSEDNYGENTPIYGGIEVLNQQGTDTPHAGYYRWQSTKILLTMTVMGEAIRVEIVWFEAWKRTKTRCLVVMVYP